MNCVQNKKSFQFYTNYLLNIITHSHKADIVSVSVRAAEFNSQCDNARPAGRLVMLCKLARF